MEKNGNQNKRAKRPWPTKDAMAQVYEKNLWGGESTFYSGEGSHRPELVGPYIDVVRTFLRSFDPALSVCDLGCGDFNVGKELVALARSYVAVDIVPALIVRNQEKFKAENLEFRCMDIAVDDLPPADCALLRQVLQHLSNAEVQGVVEKLDRYRYVILTEHLPIEDFIPNRDIISGQGIRLKKGSGVDLLAPPFNFRVKEEKQLLSLDAGGGKGQIVTRLYRVK
ncbi:class I SAM-dependent methyltransferase [Pseudozobellia thermophila]|uniref:Methyltransferase domain-containing protein n=1 Tax=Pseudozobellia thermophila TaxID=192903 RepID=A0A1M6LZL9_9FLAO|nr:class I SAM-dependent methyltransferase [Pseudozobellia thermophila]SHJ76709.1 Methyltransferase domain-containing protein [Pseudozobellia thermophila]